MESLKKHQEACTTKGKSSLSPPMFYAQATNSMASILKIKEAFLALPNKKILEIYNTVFPKLDNKGQKVQHTVREYPRE